MLTLNAILKEIKDVPVNRLDELYQLVHSLTSGAKPSEKAKKKILSFGGSFSDFNEKDYQEFVAHTKEARTNLFDRKVDL